MKIDKQKVIKELYNVIGNMEGIIEELEDAYDDAYDEQTFEDACIYGESLIDSSIYRLGLAKDELNKGIE